MEIMLFAKLPDIDQYVFVKLDTKDLVTVTDVSKLVAPITMIALEINGVVNQNAKILVLHLEHADVTPNAGRTQLSGNNFLNNFFFTDHFLIVFF